jgi:hypothetical protein
VANATNIGSAIAGVTTKATPVDADSLWITDSAAANAAKRVTFANLKTWVTGVVNTWWGTVTTAVKTTGDQTIAGKKSLSSRPAFTSALGSDLNEGVTQGDIYSFFGKPKIVTVPVIVAVGANTVTTFNLNRAFFGFGAVADWTLRTVKIEIIWGGSRLYQYYVAGLNLQPGDPAVSQFTNGSAYLVNQRTDPYMEISIPGWGNAEFPVLTITNKLQNGNPTDVILIATIMP